MVCPLVFKFAFGVLNKCAATVNIKARSVNLNEFNNCRMVTHLHPYVPDCDRIRIQVCAFGPVCAHVLGNYAHHNV